LWHHHHLLLEGRMSAILADPNDPKNRAGILAYEAECLRVLRERLLTEGELIQQRGRAIAEVGLRGWAPNTQIECEVKEAGGTHRRQWSVWHESVLDPQGKGPTAGDAQIFVSIIITNLEE